MSRAAVSRSTIPSSLASIVVSNADVSKAGGDVCDGSATSGALAADGPRRFGSLARGTPPSFACTVRSCRSSKSRRTKVLRHFWHLKGRSFVSDGILADDLTKIESIGSMMETGSSSMLIYHDLRDLSCRLRCSLRLNARLQN